MKKTVTWIIGTIVGLITLIGAAFAIHDAHDQSNDIMIMTMNYDKKFLRDDKRYYEQQIEKIEAKYDLEHGGKITNPRDKRNYDYYIKQLTITEEKIRGD